MKGYIHSIESLGTFDGEGLRTVVFFAGCPMRCIYCHNPDTFEQSGGNLVEAEQVADKVARYKNYIRRGGATLSGGEPLMQAEFALELVRLLKDRGIPTALDTAGSVFAPEVIDECEMVILDIKHADEKKFREICGMKMDNTLKTLDYLKKTKKRFWVRQVIVEGITDDAMQVKRLAEMSAGAEKIELLGYHTLGLSKWEKLGLDYKLSGMKDFDRQRLSGLQKIADTALAANK